MSRGPTSSFDVATWMIAIDLTVDARADWASSAIAATMATTNG